MACWLLAIVIPLYSTPAVALDLYWKCGDGDWWDSFGVTGGCWATSPGGTPSFNAPADGDNVYLTQSGSTDMTVGYWDPDPAANLSVLTVDATSAGNMTLQSVDVHNLNTIEQYVGNFGTGAILWDQGTNTADFLSLGHGSTSHGTYTLSGTGSLSVGNERIGQNGVGTFSQSGGSHTVANDLIMGNGSSGNGTYDLSGSGTLSTGQNEIIGGFGAGTFTQTGGSHTVGFSLVLGLENFSNGTYDLSGSGTLQVGGEAIGQAGTGTFTQTGGSHTVNNQLQLGYESTGSGTYELSGSGVLSANTELIGIFGNGTFTQTGGSHTVTNNLTLGLFSSGNGTYDLSGSGTLQVGSEYIGSGGAGTFTQSGGAHTVTTDLYLGYSNTSNGNYNLSGGTLEVEFARIGHNGVGTFTQTGGTNTVNNALYLGAFAGSGTYNLNGGTLNVGQNIFYGTGTGVFNFNAGTLNFGSDLAINATGPLANLTLGTFHNLSVGGTTTLNGTGTLTLAGGTFSTGSLVDNGGFSFESGTLNLTSDNLTVGSGGLFGPLVLLDFSKEVNVTNNTIIDSGAVLLLDNGRLSSGTTTNNGTIDFDGPLSTLGGGELTNNNLVSGNGRITAQVNNAAGGEIRVLGGDLLTFTAATNTNQGDISLLGGTVEFNQDLTNTTAGIISGTGNLITTGGLTNQGVIALSGGTSGIAGDVDNTSGGTIIVSGNSTATFFDDVIHNGTEFRVSNGSSAVFFGSVSGAGDYTGTGSWFFEGDLRPGSSPGRISVEGDMHLGLSAQTIMEIAGLDRGAEYDAFDIGGDLWLDGALEVVLYDAGSGLFTLQLGDTFDLFTAEAITGDFDLLTLAALGGGLDWQLDVLTDAIGLTDVVRLSVVASTVPVPPAVWLFGSGLLGLIGVARRRQAA
jgi:hypothetical protein